MIREFKQKDEDINFDKLTASTVKAQTTRILFALTAENSWDIQQINTIAAFLNKEVKDDVFVKLSVRYRQKDKICKLKKALYDLRTSPAI